MVQKTSAGAKAAPKPQQRGTSFGALDTASHGDVKTKKMKWVYHGIPSSIIDYNRLVSWYSVLYDTICVYIYIYHGTILDTNLL